ncbi:Transcription factor LHW-like protein [Drosera capensis]
MFPMVEDSCNIKNKSCLTKHKRTQEPAKFNKKILRHGRGSRPRPKDRQLIQDRISELREIILEAAKASDVRNDGFKVTMRHGIEDKATHLNPGKPIQYLWWMLWVVKAFVHISTVIFRVNHDQSEGYGDGYRRTENAGLVTIGSKLHLKGLIIRKHYTVEEKYDLVPTNRFSSSNGLLQN